MLAHPVLEVVGPVLGNETAIVHLNRYSRRRRSHLRRVVEAKTLASLRRRLAASHDFGDEAVELRRRNALGAPIDERQDGEEGVFIRARLPRREVRRFARYLVADAHEGSPAERV